MEPDHITSQKSKLEDQLLCWSGNSDSVSTNNSVYQDSSNLILEDPKTPDELPNSEQEMLSSITTESDNSSIPIPPQHTNNRQFNPPKINLYLKRKNIAIGMMALGLVSANINQLRYLMETPNYYSYYFVSASLISFSFICQILLVTSLIINHRYNIEDKTQIKSAHKSNNIIVLVTFIGSLVNIIIAAYEIAGSRK